MWDHRTTAEIQSDEALSVLRERLAASDPWNEGEATYSPYGRNDALRESYGDLPAAGACNVTGGTVILTTTDARGDNLTFRQVSVDTAVMERGVLVFERNDHGGSDVELVYVPNVVYWITTPE